MKAATGSSEPVKAKMEISIHAAREGGDAKALYAKWDGMISIHAAREGGDSQDPCIKRLKGISIHAAREGGDQLDNGHAEERTHFNPRRP